MPIQLRDKVRENGLVMEQITNNTTEQAMLGNFSITADDAIMDSGDADNNQMMQLLVIPLRQRFCQGGIWANKINSLILLLYSQDIDSNWQHIKNKKS